MIKFLQNFKVELYPKPWTYTPRHVINNLSTIWHWFLLIYPFIERLDFWRKDLLHYYVFQFSTVSYYWMTTAQWIHFWSWEWYSAVLFAYIMGCNWKYLGWKKAKAYYKYWRLWNKILFFFIPFRALHTVYNHRYLFTLFYGYMFYFLLNDYLGFLDFGFYLTYYNHGRNGLSAFCVQAVENVVQPFMFFQSSFNLTFTNTLLMYQTRQFKQLSELLLSKLTLSRVGVLEPLFQFGFIADLNENIDYWLRWFSFILNFVNFQCLYAFNIWSIVSFIVTWNFIGIFIVLAYYFFSFVEPIRLLIILISLFMHSIFVLFWFNMEFLSMLILIVYIGAVSILFLFVVMLLNIREEIQLTSKVIKLLCVVVYFAAITWALGTVNVFSPVYSSQVLLVATPFNNFNGQLAMNNFQPWFNFTLENWISHISSTYELLNQDLFIKTTNNYFIDMYIFSKFLYTFYCVHLIMLGMLLLLSMVGSLAILLAV